MVNVKSLNSDNRTRLSTPSLNGDEQSRNENGHCEPYGSEEESYWPKQWRALWPAQTNLDSIHLAFFSLSRSFVIHDMAFNKNPHLQLLRGYWE